MGSLRSRIERSLNKSWYSQPSWTKILAPFSWLYGLLARKRRERYAREKHPVWHAPVPVCVVGNITVGGTGKTPLIIWLAQWLIRREQRVGIVSRGYGGSSSFPLEVTPETSFQLAGDEPLLIARRTDCPVIVDPNRTRAAQRMIELHDVDIVLSDDGMQHYALDRNLEIAVLDGNRKIGNGKLLPCGPLREPSSRLSSVDWVVSNGCKTHLVEDEWVMQYRVNGMVNVADESRLTVAEFQERHGSRVRAFAGIGNPCRFQQTLLRESFEFNLEAYSDHHVFSESDFRGSSDEVFVVTEKDAQRIRNLQMIASRVWYVEIAVEFEDDVNDHLTKMFGGCGLSVDVNL